MSTKNTDPELLNNGGSVKFVVGKQSRFQPNISGKKGYYEAVKQMRFGPDMQNKFLQNFGSQVMPLQLPGANAGGVVIPPVQVGYLVSETSLYLITEDNNKMIQE